METKTCTKCGETKELGEFHKNTKRGMPGTASRCKQCISEQKRKYRKSSPEKIIERNRKYHATNREKISKRKRKYREANSEKLAEENREYRAANRKNLIDYFRAHYQQTIATFGSENLGAARSAKRYYDKHGTMDGWKYEPSKRKSK